MTSAVQERIEAVKARIAKETERLAELEKRAAEGPKRTASRTPEQIGEILLLQDELRKRYGCGFAGLADIARKAKVDGVEAPVEVRPEEGGELRGTPVDGEPAPDPSVPPLPQQEPVYDPDDEPPVPNPPEAQQAVADEEPPW